MSDEKIDRAIALLESVLVHVTQLGANVEDVRARVKALEEKTETNHAGVRLAMGRIEGVEESIDRRLGVIESRTAPLATIAEQMVKITADTNDLREKTAEHIKQQVEKALDEFLPIERISSGGVL